MGKKSDQRDQRRAKKIAAFESARASTVGKVTLNSNPQIASNILPLKQEPQVGVTVPSLDILHAPKAVKDGSRFGLKMGWCHRKSDTAETWSWGESRAWMADEWANDILPSMNEFTQMTWGYIDTFGSGSGHKMHHNQPLDAISAEAQARWMQLDLEQFDSLFRFRLGNTRRVWGFILQAHFFMVWYERHHQIAPTTK